MSGVHEEIPKKTGFDPDVLKWCADLDMSIEQEHARHTTETEMGDAVQKYLKLFEKHCFENPNSYILMQALVHDYTEYVGYVSECYDTYIQTFVQFALEKPEYSDYTFITETLKLYLQFSILRWYYITNNT